MTNKLPVVGKRQTLEEVLDKCDNADLWTPTQIICFISDYLDGSIGEELPEDKAETKKLCNWCKTNGEGFCSEPCDIKPETPSSELSPEVKESMEELELCIIDESKTKYRTIFEKAKNLLNALDNQFLAGSKVSKTKEQENKINENLAGSIWKPVSELNNKEISSCYMFVKFFDDSIDLMEWTYHNKTLQIARAREFTFSFDDKRFKEYLPLTDFINQYNSLLDRVERLERIIGDKNE